MTPIAPLIEAFLNETLARQRGASRHTRDSYALSVALSLKMRRGFVGNQEVRVAVNSRNCH